MAKSGKSGEGLHDGGHFKKRSPDQIAAIAASTGFHGRGGGVLQKTGDGFYTKRKDGKLKHISRKEAEKRMP